MKISILILLLLVAGCGAHREEVYMPGPNDPETVTCLGDTKEEQAKIRLHLERSAEKRAKLHHWSIIAE